MFAGFDFFPNSSNLGGINLKILEKYLIQFQDRVNYVSITGLSNVTGIINPINEIAKLVA